MRDFHKLQVWTKSHEFAVRIYQVTQTFPQKETFGLTSQIRRASVSIPSNIAEGCGRDGEAELRRFLEIASGSASEVEYQLLLSRDIGYLDSQNYQALNQQILEIKRMLASLKATIRAGKTSPAPRA